MSTKKVLPRPVAEKSCNQYPATICRCLSIAREFFLDCSSLGSFSRGDSARRFLKLGKRFDPWQPWLSEALGLLQGCTSLHPAPSSSRQFVAITLRLRYRNEKESNVSSFLRAARKPSTISCRFLAPKEIDRQQRYVVLLTSPFRPAGPCTQFVEQYIRELVSSYRAIEL